MYTEKVCVGTVPSSSPYARRMRASSTFSLSELLLASAASIMRTYIIAIETYAHSRVGARVCVRACARARVCVCVESCTDDRHCS
jgi:hypothetical protein